MYAITVYSWIWTFLFVLSNTFFRSIKLGRLNSPYHVNYLWSQQLGKNPKITRKTSNRKQPISERIREKWACPVMPRLTFCCLLHSSSCFLFLYFSLCSYRYGLKEKCCLNVCPFLWQSSHWDCLSWYSSFLSCLPHRFFCFCCWLSLALSVSFPPPHLPVASILHLVSFGICQLWLLSVTVSY